MPFAQRLTSTGILVRIRVSKLSNNATAKERGRKKVLCGFKYFKNVRKAPVTPPPSSPSSEEVLEKYLECVIPTERSDVISTGIVTLLFYLTPHHQCDLHIGQPRAVS